ncbi:MAG: TIGR02453 family protein, partial [Gemmatimonadota bacterium]
GRYEDEVRDPALEFIQDSSSRLKALSPHFRADPRASGGSLFRIYRDTRFSKDKSPYKTYTGIQFRHEQGKDAHAPGFYLHIEPKGCFVGVGIWHPDGKAVKKIREAIVEDSTGWKKAVSGSAFKARLSLSGDQLVRPPRGFDPEHPLVGDLKRKDFIAVAPISMKQVTEPGFIKDFASHCQAGMPLVAFLCGALDLPF